MTMFATVESLEQRALDMPHTRHMLSTLARLHEGPARSVPVSRLWRCMFNGAEKHGQEEHMNAAHHAGLIDVKIKGSTEQKNVSLTDKGRAIIGADKPLWMVA